MPSSLAVHKGQSGRCDYKMVEGRRTRALDLQEKLR